MGRRIIKKRRTRIDFSHVMHGTGWLVPFARTVRYLWIIARKLEEVDVKRTKTKMRDSEVVKVRGTNICSCSGEIDGNWLQCWLHMLCAMSGVSEYKLEIENF